MKKYYGTNIYNTITYGAGQPADIPATPTGFYVIREKDYYILKWNADALLINGGAQYPSNYTIHRSDSISHHVTEQIASISTLDKDGLVDTCYVDAAIDPTKTYTYRISALNNDGYASVPTDWKTDFLMHSDNRYFNTGIYTDQKMQPYYSALFSLAELDVFDTEPNVLPLKRIYTNKGGATSERNEYLYCVRISNAEVSSDPSWNGSSAFLTVYVNGAQYTSGYTCNGYFYAILNALPDSRHIRVELCDSSGSIRYRTTVYKTYNYLIYTTALAKAVHERRYAIESARADLIVSDVSSAKVYENFGIFFNYTRPQYLTEDQYRDSISGSVISNRPGLFSAGMHGGTVLGIKYAIQSITGFEPAISTYQNRYGWFIRNSKTDLIKKKCIIAPSEEMREYFQFLEFVPSYWGGDEKYWGSVASIETVGGIPGQVSYEDQFYGTWNDAYADDMGLVIAWSKAYKNNTLRVYVPGSRRRIIRETFISSSSVDYIQGNDIVIDPNNTFEITDQLGVVYPETAYTVNTLEGSITWVEGQPRPSEGTMCYVTYTISYKRLIRSIVKKIQLPQQRLAYIWG